MGKIYCNLNAENDIQASNSVSMYVVII